MSILKIDKYILICDITIPDFDDLKVIRITENMYLYIVVELNDNRYVLIAEKIENQYHVRYFNHIMKIKKRKKNN